MKKMNKKGFTLIEMLVVIAIIAILVAIVIPTVSNATEKAKQATDVANIRSLVAQYQIELLNGDASDSEAAFASFAKKAAKGTYLEPTFTDGKGTVTYIATLLKDGNGVAGKLPANVPNGTDPKNVYTWDLGDLVTETTEDKG